MTPRAFLFHWRKEFGAAGVPDPLTDAAILLSHLTSRGMLELRMDDMHELDADTVTQFEELAARRMTREPLQYILGEAPFMGHTFAVCPDVLIPRPETELLVEFALQSLQKLSGTPRVLDLCCGSGCIGISVKLAHPNTIVTCSDISPDALEITRQNAATLHADVALRQGDLFGAVSGTFDLIISNPPYIPSSDCRELQQEVLQEPMLALDGGEDGLDLYRRIAAEAGKHLVHGGQLMMEIGIGEADAICSLLKASGFGEIRVEKDLAGIDRMILARWSVD